MATSFFWYSNALSKTRQCHIDRRPLRPALGLLRKSILVEPVDRHLAKGGSHPGPSTAPSSLKARPGHRCKNKDGSRLSLRFASSAIIASVCFSATRNVSFCLRFSVSTAVPYHRTTEPVASRRG